MNPVLEHLIVLQAQDLELQRMRTEVAEAPSRVAAADAARAAAEKRVVDLRHGLGTEERLRRDQERDIAGHRATVDRLRRAMETATSEAQVTAFANQISFAEMAAGRLEEEELGSLERTDRLEAELAEAAAMSADLQGTLERERRQAAGLLEENGVKIAGLEGQRTSLRAEVGERWLAVYDRLSRAKGTAVAEALGNATAGKCAACQMGVRPQRWQDIIGREHEEEIYTCESCGRLLFWDPRRDTPRSWQTGDRLESAQGGRRPGSVSAPTQKATGSRG